MKLEQLLGELDHEVWVRLTLPDGCLLDIWSADYHGGQSETILALEPYLQRDITDVAVEMVKPPEKMNVFRRTGFAPFLCAGVLKGAEDETE